MLLYASGGKKDPRIIVVSLYEWSLSAISLRDMTPAGLTDPSGRNLRHAVPAAQTLFTSSCNKCGTVRLTFAQILMSLLETERSPRSLKDSYSTTEREYIDKSRELGFEKTTCVTLFSRGVASYESCKVKSKSWKTVKPVLGYSLNKLQPFWIVSSNL